jgi:dTDP-L-rhamnose 4-epimerase
MDILITGGAGFIGTALTTRLLENDRMRVTVVDVLHPQVHATEDWPTETPAQAARLRLDVTSPAAWDEILDVVRPDVVVHLAAETGTGQSFSEASRHSRVNVVGTTEMLDAFTRHAHTPSGIVLASSRAVYGEGRWVGEDGRPFYARTRDVARLEAGQWDPDGGVGAIRPLPHRAATTEPRPISVYAATKLAQEHVLTSWTAAAGCRLSILRLQNVYGPGQSLTNPYTGIVSLFVRLGAEGEPAQVYEDGDILRDFVFVDDVVSALAAAVERTDGPALPVVDIGSGESVTLLALARLVAAETGAPEPVVCGRFRTGDVRAAHADIADAAAHLGYVPKTDLVSGVRQLLEWIATR